MPVFIIIQIIIIIIYNQLFISHNYKCAQCKWPIIASYCPAIYARTYPNNGN